jgi:glycosyltransferase involved in cell wall biosynthesis
LGQTWGNVELIVVDDGSKDRSRDILRGYGGRIRLLEQANQGPYKARNNGLRHATGEFVAFLDADDWWAPDCLEKLHAALSSRPDAALAYCGWQNVGAMDRGNDPFVPPDYEVDGKVEMLLRSGSPWPIHAVLSRLQVIGSLGGFRDDLATSLDYEMWLRVAATCPVVRVPEVLAFYRFHGGGQISANPWRQAINGWRIKQRFLAEHHEIASSLPRGKVLELVDGFLLRSGYQFYWNRDLVSAQHIFRRSLFNGGWKLKDLAYLIPALLPAVLYQRLISSMDK